MKRQFLNSLRWIRRYGVQSFLATSSFIFSALSLYIAVLAFQLTEEEQLATLRIVLKLDEKAESDAATRLVPAQEEFILQAMDVVFPTPLQKNEPIRLFPSLKSPEVLDIHEFGIIKFLESYHSVELKEFPLALGSLDVPVAITSDYIARGRRIEFTALYDLQYFYGIGSPPQISGPHASVTKITFLRAVQSEEDLQKLVDAVFRERKPKGP